MHNNNFDIIQISYDEPNAEKNFSVLKHWFPNALRVQNIKGFDQAHCHAASISSKDWIFVVDGDCEVKVDFFDDVMNFSEAIEPYLDQSQQTVLSWAAKNSVNGLIYGNGGIKLWPRSLLEKVNSHQKGGLDWVGEIDYQQMNNWYGYSVINASPYQAWRSGIREGTKFCMVKNQRVRFPHREIWHQNLTRLLIWCSVGTDQTHGEYAILGARMGAWLTLTNGWNPHVITDYDALFELWNGEYAFIRDGFFFEYQRDITANLRRYYDLPIVDLLPEQSRWVKGIYQNPKRDGVLKKWRDETIR